MLNNTVGVFKDLPLDFRLIVICSGESKNWWYRRLDASSLPTFVYLFQFPVTKRPACLILPGNPAMPEHLGLVFSNMALLVT